MQLLPAARRDEIEGPCSVSDAEEHADPALNAIPPGMESRSSELELRALRRYERPHHEPSNVAADATVDARKRGLLVSVGLVRS